MNTLTFLEGLLRDARHALRMIRFNPVFSTAAILSLALAIGSCTSAFRLIDALILRPLPVRDPDRLYAAVRQGIDFDGALERCDGLAVQSDVRVEDAQQ